MKDSSPHERLEQKQRTREAILAGARALMERGESVTVAAAAAEARVSKATAYRYFPEPSALAAEAGLAVKVPAYEEIVAGVSGVRARLVAINVAMFELTLENEAAFRQFLARSLDAWLAERANHRGARRVEMYLRAMDEDGGVPEAVRGPLARALAVNTGIEAAIGLFDIAHASRDEARETVRAAATALVEHYLGG